jgi:hypothetical protein
MPSSDIELVTRAAVAAVARTALPVAAADAVRPVPLLANSRVAVVRYTIRTHVDDAAGRVAKSSTRRHHW